MNISVLSARLNVVDAEQDPSLPQTLADRKSRRRSRTYASLIRAAEGLFARSGVDGVSIDQIASQADVAKGTFYNYFEDKQALVGELYVAARVELTEQISRVNALIEDPAERLTRAMCCVLRSVVSKPDRMLAMMRMNAFAAQGDARAERGVRLELRQAIAQARFSVPSEDAALTFVDGIFQAASWRASTLTGLKEVSNLAQEVGELLLLGLGVPRSEARETARSAALAIFVSCPEA